jgi:hypothetical protein
MLKVFGNSHPFDNRRFYRTRFQNSTTNILHHIFLFMYFLLFFISVPFWGKKCQYIYCYKYGRQFKCCDLECESNHVNNQIPNFDLSSYKISNNPTINNSLDGLLLVAC